MENTKTPKMTYSTALSAVINGEPITDEIVKKLTALCDSLEKKTASKKPTEQQEKNAGFKTAIYDFMEPGKRYTITQLRKSVPALVADPEAASSQRVSALMTQMVTDKEIVRTEEKRVAYFSLPAEEEEESAE